jgi:hypothetical protein
VEPVVPELKRIPHRIAAGALGALAVVVMGSPASSAPATRMAEAAAPPQTEVIELARQTLVFQPTRDDMTVHRVLFSVFSSDPEALRVNGSPPAPDDVHADPNHAWMHIELPQAAKNRFEFAQMKIEFAPRRPQALLCVSVKAWFGEVSNQYDALYYENVKDRYALVAYCTKAPDWPPVKARFGMNRVASVREFKEALARPFVIALNQRPLPQGSSAAPPPEPPPRGPEGRPDHRESK